MLTYNFFVESNKDYSNWDIFPFQTTNCWWLLLVQATQSPPQLQQPSAHQTFYPWMAIAGRRYGYSRVLSNFDISVHRYSQHLAMALSLCSKCPQVLSYFVCYNKQAFNQGISTCNCDTNIANIDVHRCHNGWTLDTGDTGRLTCTASGECL